MKLLFIGDSITDMCRNREGANPYCFGNGYVFLLEAALAKKYPGKFTVINRGISGNRIVDVYQRIKVDCWNLEPDVITILIGANDVWHEISRANGVEPDRFERFYDMLIEDTKKVLPNVKIVVMGAFLLHGTVTEEQHPEFSRIKRYAQIAEAVAKRHGCVYVPLQPHFDAAAAAHTDQYYLFDGIHPTVAGAGVIAEQWLQSFEANIL